MAKTENPDQTAPSVWSGSALFAYGILSDTFLFKISGHLSLCLHNLIIV